MVLTLPVYFTVKKWWLNILIQKSSPPPLLVSDISVPKARGHPCLSKSQQTDGLLKKNSPISTKKIFEQHKRNTLRCLSFVFCVIYASASLRLLCHLRFCVIKASVSFSLLCHLLFCVIYSSASSTLLRHDLQSFQRKVCPRGSFPVIPETVLIFLF